MPTNKSNKHLVANLSKALKCAKELDSYGLTIQSIDLEGSKPRILIENVKKLAEVKRTIHAGVVSTGNQRFEKLSTNMNGTEVQWQRPIQ